MPSAVAEGRTVAMGTEARSWRLNIASRLQWKWCPPAKPTPFPPPALLCHQQGGHLCLSSPHEAGGGTIERWRNKVDAMVTGRVAPIILLAVWVSSLGFAGRSNARRALDSNPLM